MVDARVDLTTQTNEQTETCIPKSLCLNNSGKYGTTKKSHAHNV